MPSLQQSIRNKLRGQKIKAYEIQAIMPPVEGRGEIEVWLTALVSGERHAAHYAVYVLDEPDAEAELHEILGPHD